MISACENNDVEMIEILLKKETTFQKEIDLMNGYEFKLDIHIKVDKSPLVVACLNGSSNAVRYLFSNYSENFIEKSVYWDAFAATIKKGNILLIDLLIEMGGDINIIEQESQRNLLMIASIFGNIEVIRHVFSKGNFDINTQDASGKGAFYYSLMTSDNVEIVKFLIENGANYKSQTLFYPIQMACFFRNVALFDFLIEIGAEIVDVNTDFRNLLHIACNSGSLELVKRLIERHGFDANVPNTFKATPLHFTVQDTNPSLSGCLLKDFPYLINFNEKTDDECIAIAQSLLENGADIYASDDYENTAISETCLYNREKVFDYFVDYYKNVLNKPLELEKNKNILISIANTGSNLNFLQKVLDKGANVNWSNIFGFSALMGACSSGNYEICSRLIELGADINALDDWKYSALHYLCKKGDDNVDILRLLLQNGADIYSTTNDDSNSLHLAARSVSLKIVKELLLIGFDPNLLNTKFETPLHSVLSYGQTGNETKVLEVVKVLVEAGARIDAENEDDVTPLTAAKCLKFRKVARYLKKNLIK